MRLFSTAPIATPTTEIAFLITIIDRTIIVMDSVERQKNVSNQNVISGYCVIARALSQLEVSHKLDIE
ncbi:hypothetical protein GCM10007877_02930 [Marinibactrum halimedae]|uniref:Uncharacterized protein n=1 Tax=Marinibactrum halimedae TaxID=1444977 RepID=A0AA37T253_9GAMM|nr:hypothetical protein GCM10007877_02930 [Marinibactrum halimedae]